MGRIFAAFDQFDKAYRGALQVDEALYAAETVITCYRTIKGEEG